MPVNSAFMAPILLLAVLVWPNAPERIFACELGTKRVEIVREGSTLIYRFGRPGRPELVLSGPVHYHRTLYARGEDQTLRFVRGGHSYVVFNRWNAPGPGGSEHNASGILVFRGAKRIARLDCSAGGDLREHPLFATLPLDAENRTPDDA